MMVEPLMYGLLGFYGGSVFGAVMALAEHRRTISELRMWRVAVWGALAGLLVPVVYHLFGGGAGLSWFSSLWTSADVWISLAIIAPLGAGSAAGMTAIGRSASELAVEGGATDPHLLESGGRPRSS